MDHDFRRKAGRIRLEAVTTSRGDAIDISVAGIGIHSNKAIEVDTLLDLRIEGWGESVSVHARVARCEKAGFRKYEIGLEFIDVEDADRQVLNRIARFGHAES